MLLSQSNIVGQSRYWKKLWEHYPCCPSIVLCRVPELEFAAQLNLNGQALDHCCGDGRFASLAWPGTSIAAGCDIDSSSTRQALQRGGHARIDCCDASKELPYQANTFSLVFNNSAFEHILDLPAALESVARVIAPSGTLAFNVLNHRYFDWWPLDKQAMAAYREWQPFFHALSIDEWRQRLDAVGLEITSYEGYFDRQAAAELAYLDYEFSGHALHKRPSRLASTFERYPRALRFYWRRRLARLTWKTEPDAGAGYFIQARKKA